MRHIGLKEVEEVPVIKKKGRNKPVEKVETDQEETENEEPENGESES